MKKISESIKANKIIANTINFIMLLGKIMVNQGTIIIGIIIAENKPTEARTPKI